MTKKITKTKRIKNVKSVSVLNSSGGASLGLFPTGIGPQVAQTDSMFFNMRFYLVSNMRQPLSEAYAEIGLVQTVVDVPVEDAFRGGVEVQSKQISPEQIENIQVWLERKQIISKHVTDAHKWNRLYGGAGIIILTDQDPEEPLNMESLTKESDLSFKAVDMWELFYDKQNAEGYNPAIQMEAFEFYNYYGTKIHKSRVMPLKGITPPSFIKPRLRGWGLSVVETLVAPLNQYLKTRNVCFEVMDEFKVDYYKIEGLAATLLTPIGKNKIQNRVADMNMMKNYQNAVTMDSKDSFETKQLSFAGLADIPKENRMDIASTLRMPMSKVFGISASGFNSGEDDIENYNAMIESSIRSSAKFEILKMIELYCQCEFGVVPDDLKIIFKPLRVLSSIDEETIKTQKFARLIQAKQAGLMTTEEFKQACNKDNLLGIQVDDSIDTLEMEQADISTGEEIGT